MYAWGIFKPATSVAEWSSSLLGTYPLVRKTPRPEIWSSLTLLATGSGDLGYSGPEVGNSACDRPAVQTTSGVSSAQVLLLRQGLNTSKHKSGNLLSLL